METRTRTYIRIDNNWFRNESYIQKTSKLAFAVYILLLEREGCNNRIFFTVDYLITHLGMNKKNRHMADKIKVALSSLEECNLIHFHKNVYDDDVIEFSSLNVNKSSELYVSVEIPTQKYTFIYAYEMFAILLSDYGDYNARVGMLSQFCYIISCINSAHNVSFPSMANVMECSAIGSYSTFKDHLDKLVELNLLVYRNPNVMNNKGSKVTQTPNHYARPIHEADLDAMVEEKISKMNKTPMSNNTRELGILKRSITQKMNNIHDKEKAGTITDDDRISLYEMAEQYNQLCISCGQEPRFNINAKPEEIVISTENIESFVVDNALKVLKMNKRIDPFKTPEPSKPSKPLDPFESGVDIDRWLA